MADESISKAREWLVTFGAIASIFGAIVAVFMIGLLLISIVSKIDNGFIGIGSKIDNGVLLQTDTKRMVDDISVDGALDRSSPGSAWKRLAWKGINDSNHRGYLEPAGELRYRTAEQWKGAKSLIPESKRREIDEILAKADEIHEEPIEDLMSIVITQLGGASWLSCIKDPETDYLPTYTKLGIMAGYIEEKRRVPQ